MAQRGGRGGGEGGDISEKKYEDMLQSLRTSFLLQKLRTPMLFNGWLIDWVSVAGSLFHFL